MNAGRVLKLYLLFLAVSLFTRAYMIPVEVIDLDESFHAVGSWVWMDGGRLYTDYIDNKPPLLYIAYAAAQSLFGRGLIAVHLFTALFVVPLTALACAAFYDFSRRGVIAGLLFLVYSAAFLAHDMHSTNGEILMILPGAWALVLARDADRGRKPWRLFCAGLLLGAGSLLKYQVAAWLPAVLVASIYESISKKEAGKLIAAAAVGFALPLLLVAAWFQANGGAGDLVEWAYRANFAYTQNPISPREAIGRFVSYALPFLLVTLPLWWCCFRMRHAEPSRYRKILIAALLALSLACCFLGFRFYPHYFIQLYVPLCLGAAPYAAELLADARRSGRLFLAWTVLMWALFAAVNLYLYYGSSRVYRETDPVFRQVAARVQQDSCYSGGSMFVWGYSPLYYHVKLKPASRFAVLSQGGIVGYISGNMGSVAGATAGTIRQDHRDLLISDLVRNRATYIIDTSPAAIYRWDRYPLSGFPELQRLIADRYERIDNVEGIQIYRDRGCEKSR